MIGFAWFRNRWGGWGIVGFVAAVDVRGVCPVWARPRIEDDVGVVVSVDVVDFVLARPALHFFFQLFLCVALVSISHLTSESSIGLLATFYPNPCLGV